MTHNLNRWRALDAAAGVHMVPITTGHHVVTDLLPPGVQPEHPDTQSEVPLSLLVPGSPQDRGCCRVL